MPSPEELGKGKGKGKGKDKGQTPCWYLVNQGTCAYGDNCMFKHDGVQANGPNATTQAPGAPKPKSKSAIKLAKKVAKELKTRGIQAVVIDAEVGGFPAIDTYKSPHAYDNTTKVLEQLAKAVAKLECLPDWHPPEFQRENKGRASVTGRPPKRWLSDTGARYDMIGKNILPDDPETYERMKPTSRRMTISTGNGVTTVRNELPLQSGLLQEGRLSPILMENCPPVLALGKRIMTGGYGFYWPPGAAPILVRPDGTIIRHEIQDYLPYMREPDGWSFQDHPSRETSNPLAMPQRVDPVGGNAADGLPSASSTDRHVAAQAHDEQKLSEAEQRLQVAQDAVTELRGETKNPPGPNTLEHLLTHLPAHP